MRASTGSSHSKGSVASLHDLLYEISASLSGSSSRGVSAAGAARPSNTQQASQPTSSNGRGSDTWPGPGVSELGYYYSYTGDSAASAPPSAIPIQQQALRSSTSSDGIGQQGTNWEGNSSHNSSFYGGGGLGSYRPSNTSDVASNDPNSLPVQDAAQDQGAGNYQTATGELDDSGMDEPPLAATNTASVNSSRRTVSIARLTAIAEESSSNVSTPTAEIAHNSGGNDSTSLPTSRFESGFQSGPGTSIPDSSPWTSQQSAATPAVTEAAAATGRGTTADGSEPIGPARAGDGSAAGLRLGSSRSLRSQQSAANAAAEAAAAAVDAEEAQSLPGSTGSKYVQPQAPVRSRSTSSNGSSANDPSHSGNSESSLRKAVYSHAGSGSQSSARDGLNQSSSGNPSQAGSTSHVVLSNGQVVIANSEPTSVPASPTTAEMTAYLRHADPVDSWVTSQAAALLPAPAWGAQQQQQQQRGRLQMVASVKYADAALVDSPTAGWSSGVSSLSEQQQQQQQQHERQRRPRGRLQAVESIRFAAAAAIVDSPTAVWTSGVSSVQQQQQALGRPDTSMRSLEHAAQRQYSSPTADTDTVTVASKVPSAATTSATPAASVVSMASSTSKPRSSLSSWLGSKRPSHAGSPEPEHSVGEWQQQGDSRRRGSASAAGGTRNSSRRTSLLQENTSSSFQLHDGPAGWSQPPETPAFAAQPTQHKPLPWGTDDKHVTQQQQQEQQKQQGQNLQQQQQWDWELMEPEVEQQQQQGTVTWQPDELLQQRQQQYEDWQQQQQQQQYSGHVAVDADPGNMRVAIIAQQDVNEHHALLSVLNPLEFVLWQQRQQQRMLLDRALQALTTLQADVDTLLVANQAAAVEAAAAVECRRIVLELQQQQHLLEQELLSAQQQQHGNAKQQNYSKATLTGGQSAAAVGGNAGGQWLIKADWPQREAVTRAGNELASPQVEGTAAPAAAAAAAEVDDFEAELLRLEAAAPGRRLSAETLQMYYAAHAWTENGQGDLSAVDPQHNMQQIAASAAQNGTIAASQQQTEQQQQQGGPDVAAAAAATGDLFDDFEAQLLALEAAAPGRRLSAETAAALAAEEANVAAAAAAASFEGQAPHSVGNDQLSELEQSCKPATAAAAVTHVAAAADTTDAAVTSDSGIDDFEAQLLALEATAPGRRLSAGLEAAADSLADDPIHSSSGSIQDSSQGGQGPAQAQTAVVMGDTQQTSSAERVVTVQQQRSVTFQLPGEEVSTDGNAPKPASNSSSDGSSSSGSVPGAAQPGSSAGIEEQSSLGDFEQELMALEAAAAGRQMQPGASSSSSSERPTNANSVSENVGIASQDTVSLVLPQQVTEAALVAQPAAAANTAPAAAAAATVASSDGIGMFGGSSIYGGLQAVQPEAVQLPRPPAAAAGAAGAESAPPANDISSNSGASREHNSSSSSSEDDFETLMRANETAARKAVGHTAAAPGPDERWWESGAGEQQQQEAVSSLSDATQESLLRQQQRTAEAEGDADNDDFEALMRANETAARETAGRGAADPSAAEDTWWETGGHEQQQQQQQQQQEEGASQQQQDGMQLEAAAIQEPNAVPDPAAVEESEPPASSGSSNSSTADGGDVQVLVLDFGHVGSIGSDVSGLPLSPRSAALGGMLEFEQAAAAAAAVAAGDAAGAADVPAAAADDVPEVTTGAAAAAAAAAAAPGAEASHAVPDAAAMSLNGDESSVKSRTASIAESADGESPADNSNGVAAPVVDAADTKAAGTSLVVEAAAAADVGESSSAAADHTAVTAIVDDSTAGASSDVAAVAAEAADAVDTSSNGSAAAAAADSSSSSVAAATGQQPREGEQQQQAEHYMQQQQQQQRGSPVSSGSGGVRGEGSQQQSTADSISARSSPDNNQGVSASQPTDTATTAADQSVLGAASADRTTSPGSSDGHIIISSSSGSMATTVDGSSPADKIGDISAGQADGDLTGSSPAAGPGTGNVQQQQQLAARYPGVDVTMPTVIPVDTLPTATPADVTQQPLELQHPTAASGAEQLRQNATCFAQSVTADFEPCLAPAAKAAMLNVAHMFAGSASGAAGNSPVHGLVVQATSTWSAEQAPAAAAAAATAAEQDKPQQQQQQQQDGLQFDSISSFGPIMSVNAASSSSNSITRCSIQPASVPAVAAIAELTQVTATSSGDNAQPAAAAAAAAGALCATTQAGYLSFGDSSYLSLSTSHSVRSLAGSEGVCAAAAAAAVAPGILPAAAAATATYSAITVSGTAANVAASGVGLPGSGGVVHDSSEQQQQQQQLQGSWCRTSQSSDGSSSGSNGASSRAVGQSDTSKPHMKQLPRPPCMNDVIYEVETRCYKMPGVMQGDPAATADEQQQQQVQTCYQAQPLCYEQYCGSSSSRPSTAPAAASTSRATSTAAAGISELSSGNHYSRRQPLQQQSHTQQQQQQQQLIGCDTNSLCDYSSTLSRASSSSSSSDVSGIEDLSDSDGAPSAEDPLLQTSAFIAVRSPWKHRSHTGLWHSGFRSPTADAAAAQSPKNSSRSLKPVLQQTPNGVQHTVQVPAASAGRKAVISTHHSTSPKHHPRSKAKVTSYIKKQLASIDSKLISIEMLAQNDIQEQQRLQEDLQQQRQQWQQQLEQVTQQQWAEERYGSAGSEQQQQQQQLEIDRHHAELFGWGHVAAARPASAGAMQNGLIYAAGPFADTTHKSPGRSATAQHMHSWRESSRPYHWESHSKADWLGPPAAAAAAEGLAHDYYVDHDDQQQYGKQTSFLSSSRANQYMQKHRVPCKDSPQRAVPEHFSRHATDGTGSPTGYNLLARRPSSAGSVPNGGRNYDAIFSTPCAAPGQRRTWQDPSTAAQHGPSRFGNTNDWLTHEPNDRQRLCVPQNTTYRRGVLSLGVQEPYSGQRGGPLNNYQGQLYGLPIEHWVLPPTTGAEHRQHVPQPPGTPEPYARTAKAAAGIPSAAAVSQTQPLAGLLSDRQAGSCDAGLDHRSLVKPPQSSDGASRMPLQVRTYRSNLVQRTGAAAAGQLTGVTSSSSSPQYSGLWREVMLECEREAAEQALIMSQVAGVAAESKVVAAALRSNWDLLL